MPERCVDALAEHRARQTVARSAAGERWIDHDLVFATEADTAMDAANVRRDFQRVAVAAGLDGSKVTESVYRKQLRPVIDGGATAMNRVFPRREVRPSEVPEVT